MQEEKKLFWTVRLIICAIVLAAGLVLRFAVGGQAYQLSKVWYTQQIQNSVQPNLSLENIQKQCHDFLSSGASIVAPQFGTQSALPSSSIESKKENSKAPASSAKSTNKKADSFVSAKS